MPTLALVLLSLFLICGCAATAVRGPGPAPDADARSAVWEAERAFAAAMADRDHAAFTELLSPDAIFMGGPETLRGRGAVSEGWRRYFEGPVAPFSWAPDAVEVAASGDLALSTGPVHDAAGALVGRFTSIWRREGEAWRVVFDRGN